MNVTIKKNIKTRNILINGAKLGHLLVAIESEKGIDFLDSKLMEISLKDALNIYIDYLNKYEY